MKRRSLLRAAAGASALVAGCLESGSPGTSEPTTGTPTVTPTDTPAEPRIVDRSFEVRDNSCGTGEHRASVSFAAERVTVTGAIRGSNTCYTAALDAATYDDERDRLTVAVRAYVPESDETPVCGQCIVDVEYETEVTFEGGLPGTVVVEHDGERVTASER